MLKPTKAQQTSTSKVNASKIDCGKSNVFKGHPHYTNMCSNSLSISLYFK
jgi:hypothetical protein